jgi:hypothetical protein
MKSCAEQPTVLVKDFVAQGAGGYLPWFQALGVYYGLMGNK